MASANYSVTPQRFQTAAVTHTVTLPSTVSGDLLLMHVGSLGGAASATGWTVLATPANNTTTGTLLAKVATGSETTVDVTLAASSVCALMIYKVGQWGGTLATDVDVNSRADINTDSSTVSVTAGWGAADNLAIGMVAAGDDNADVTSYPASMSDSQLIKTDTDGNNSVIVAGATEQITTASYTLTQFVFSEGEDYASVVILVKPGTSGGGGADTTPPVYEVSPAVTETRENGHTISGTADEDSVFYGVRLPAGATVPTSQQVIDGQDASGSPALEADFVAASAGISADLDFITGSASTAYRYAIVAVDDEPTPNVQATPTVIDDTTAAAVVEGISAQTIRDKTGDLTPNATNLKIAVRASSDPESLVHFSTTTGSLNGSSQTAAINLESAGVTVGDTVHFSYFNPALNEGLNVDLTVEDIA